MRHPRSWSKLCKMGKICAQNAARGVYAVVCFCGFHQGTVAQVFRLSNVGHNALLTLACRVCNVSTVIGTVNGEIDNIDTALDNLNSSLTGTMQGIAPTINTLMSVFVLARG